jgi:hypothetical protein
MFQGGQQLLHLGGQEFRFSRENLGVYLAKIYKRKPLMFQDGRQILQLLVKNFVFILPRKFRVFLAKFIKKTL